MRSLTLKLVLAFWLVSLVGITVGTLFAGRVSFREIDNLAESQRLELLVTRLEIYYQTNGSWEGIAPTSFRGSEGQAGFPGGSLILTDPQGLVLMANEKGIEGQLLSPDQLDHGRKIAVDGQVVGSLVSGPWSPAMRPPPATTIIDRISRDLLVGALAATAVSLLLGILLARALLRPIQALTKATRIVAQGDFETPVPVRSKDEIGALARSFNEMLAQLKRSRDVRRQMTADIAHELRTPLSLILGHTEAISDGVLPPTPESLAIIYEEAQQLTRLVEDLRTLSLSETGELSLAVRTISPAELLGSITAAYSNQAERQGILFEANISTDLPEIGVDADRIRQVFRNLFDNAFHYTPSGGKVILSASQVAGGVEFRVQDTGPGISPEDLPNVFERFYRGDKARSRQDGGSGLGLAIAKTMVELHRGKIWVESVPGGGTTFIILLPASP